MTPDARPHKLPPQFADSKTSRTLKERARNALITGTAGGYLGGMLIEGKARVKIPNLTRKLLGIKRRTVGIHGARAGAAVGALAGAANKGKRSDTVDAVATGGDWKFAVGGKVKVRVMRMQGKRVQAPGQPLLDERPDTKVMGLPDLSPRPKREFSAYIEDMKHGDLPKDVQEDVTRFVTAKKDTPMVHYGMTVKELLPKADPANLETARKNLGTLRASRAAGEVIAKTKAGSKYVMLMNDRIIDGHHFLAKAERGKVTSSLNVLDLTPARIATKMAAKSPALHQFDGLNRKQSAAIGAAVPVAAGGLLIGTRGGRNVLRGVLKGLDKGDPRRVRLASLMQKRKDASLARNSNKAVAKARDQFRAEALPKAPKDPTLGDAVKTVRKRVKQKVVKAVANIGANPSEVQMGAIEFGDEKKNPRSRIIDAGARIGSIVGAGIGTTVGGLKWRAPLAGAVVGIAAGAHLGRRAGSAVGARTKATDREIAARDLVAKKKQVKLSSLYKMTQFSQAEPRRTRTQNLRDKIGLAKDVAGLGVTAGAGVGAHKLYKQGKVVLRKVGPQVGGAVKAWHDAALKAGSTLDVVKDAVSPVATTNRGLASGWRKVIKVAKKATMWMHGDPRQPVTFQAPLPRKRDKLDTARDVALIGGGVGTAVAAGVLAHKGGKAVHGLAKRGRAMLRNLPVKTIGDNIRNSTRISADVGRVYGNLTDDVRSPKRYVAKVRGAFREGMQAGQAGPVKPWARRVVKVGKALRLLEARRVPVEFGAGASLLLSGVGTLVGSQAGGRLRYSIQNRVKKGLAPRVGVKWARRVGRVAGYAPENVGAIAGGVAGSVLGGGIRQRVEMSAWEFGGREQLKDLDSSGFLDPLDVFVGRKKGYTAQQVKDYHWAKNYVADVQSKRRVGSAQAVSAAQDQMKTIRGAPAQASHGQVVRSLLKKGDVVRRVSERGGGLAKDAVAHLRGDAREKDASGRVKKREWEKPWFQRTKNQLVAAAALGGGYALLKGRPKLRAKMDRGVRMVQRKVNSTVPDFFPGVKPLRQKGQKTAVKVQAKQQAAAQAKVQQTQAQVAKAATNIATAAQQAKAAGAVGKGRKIQVAKPGATKPGGATKLSGRALGRLVQFGDDPLSAGWDLRDARGRSARVFAPGSQGRDRRPKAWHERIDNERKLWSAAAAVGTLTGGVAARKLLQGQVKGQVKTATATAVNRAARWKAVAKAQHGRLKAQSAQKRKIVAFKPEPLKGAA